jgi:hypothetical protein
LAGTYIKQLIINKTSALILGSKRGLSDGGFDAHKYILTTYKPDSTVIILGVNPNSPWWELEHWECMIIQWGNTVYQ